MTLENVNESLAVDSREAARLLNISVGTLREKYLNTGLLPCVRLGRRLVIRRSSLDEFLERLESEQAPV